MEMTDKEAQVIQKIYNNYYSDKISAGEALEDLEQLINGDN